MAKKNEEQIEKEQNEKEAAEETEIVEDSAKDAKKELEALNDKYIRLAAEYDNYRKRTLREKESIYPEAKATATALFLPVLDNLERALAASNKEDPLYEGVRMVLKQFEDSLKNAGVEYIEAVGQKFDPKLHNAVMHVEDENVEENVVVEEFQKGYKIGDRVVRHSMVKVAN